MKNWQSEQKRLYQPIEHLLKIDHLQKFMNTNIPRTGDFPTLIVNNLVNVTLSQGIEFLAKIRILGTDLRVVLRRKL
jgi:hypothetical protein